MEREDVAKVGLALEVVTVGFRALEFIGKHTNDVQGTTNNNCHECTQASMECYLGLIDLDEATKKFCSQLKQAIVQYKTALIVVQQWESTEHTD